MGLTTERLLGNETVWSNSTGVNLVGHEVTKLKHIDHADHDRVVEGFAGATIIESRFTTDGAVLTVTNPGVTSGFSFALLTFANLTIVTDVFDAVDLLGFGHELPNFCFRNTVENRGSHSES